MVSGFEKCCVSDGTDGNAGEEEVGNIGNERESVSSHREAQDGNCEEK
jgi:hypothetical protein